MDTYYREQQNGNQEGTATSCEWWTAELLDRLQNGTHRGKGGTADQSITWKDGIRDSMQRRNLKDEECFDRELWRKKIVSLG
jgi:hypothetical protein